MLKPTTLAMILAGGRADELNVLTYYRPKAAVPFGGFARVIDFSLSNLMNSGIEQVAILSQYRSYSLINHIGNGAAWDMIGRYRGVSILPPFIDTDQNDWYRGSADAVYKNLDFVKYINPEEVLILSGDHIYQMDYSEVIAYHYEKDADLTIVCKKIAPGAGCRFGMAGIDDEDGVRGGKVTSYQEKEENPEGEWSSLTVLCFKPEVLYQATRRKPVRLILLNLGAILFQCSCPRDERFMVISLMVIGGIPEQSRNIGRQIWICSVIIR